MRVGRHLREIAEPFVVGPPAGARVRTRLMVSDADVAVLAEVGAHLGALAAADLASRCCEGRLDVRGKVVARRERKREMTAASSARWAGAITRTSEDMWGLGERNLRAEARSLHARTGRIRRRLAVAAGGRDGRTRGYSTPAERWEKQRRLQMLTHRLAVVEARLDAGRVSVCRGGRRLARVRHNLAAAGLDEPTWRRSWQAARWFITADGEAAALWGNLTIRWHPEQRWLELKLPTPLAHLANASRGRYRLSEPVAFPYRGDEVAAQAATGAVRYDIAFDPGKGRWYLDASWRIPPRRWPALAEVRGHPVVAVDLNAGHLAVAAVDPSGNPLGPPQTIELHLAGLPATTRDARLRRAISSLLATARAHGASAVVVEDLDFAAARAEGRETPGHPRGKRGRVFRRTVAGIPASRFRDRLAQMAANQGLAVIAVDPAYTSRWGAQHWLAPLQDTYPGHGLDGHHAASVVIGRRGLGQRARRRERCAPTPPADGRRKAINPARRPTPATTGLTEPLTREPVDRKAPGQPPPARRKTPPGQPEPTGDQAAEHRSRPPTGQEPPLASA